ncbi:hypothetical protein KP509_06G006900 [Ceratopteris richardii]|nr:hypothetical protein KP509_06G006900 [Ceratopteris richardii]
MAGKQLQSLMFKNGLQSISILGDHLIRLFASCDSLSCAVEAFNKVKEPTIYTWNAIISAHVQLGHAKKAVAFYNRLQRVGMTPDVVTFLYVVKACAGVGALEQGREVHDQFLRQGLESHAFSNSLVYMYAKCGSPQDAKCVFDRLGHRNVVSWGSLVAGSVENGDAHTAFELFEQMKESGTQPNRPIILSMLKACICAGSISQGRVAHNEVIKAGLDLEATVANALMDFYIKLSCLDDALKVFANLILKDVVSWDTIIAGLTDSGYISSALNHYEEMQSKGFEPNKYTYSCILKSFANERLIFKGMLVHDQVVRCGLESNVVVSNTLADMYGKCACIKEACKVFLNMTIRDAVSWSTIIARCVEHNYSVLALHYFEEMHQDPLYSKKAPNKSVYLCGLKACALAGDLVLGRMLHDVTIRVGFEADLTIGTTLVNIYGNHGSIEEAAFLLNSMQDPNEVTWGLMVVACVQHDLFSNAVVFLSKMLERGMVPEKACFIGILNGCSKSEAISYGRLLHSYLIECELDTDNEVKSALLNMYAKCGSSRDSFGILECFSPGNDISLWDAKIAASAWSGDFVAASQFLHTMYTHGMKPDNVVFIGLLSACCNVGAVKEGYQFFSSMRGNFNIEPGMEEYNLMAELLAQAGLTEEAEAFLLSMPCPPDFVGWMSLLTCCKASDIGLARRIFHQVIQLDPIDASGYVLMANICADAHMWEDVIEINNHLHQFIY